MTTPDELQRVWRVVEAIPAINDLSAQYQNDIAEALLSERAELLATVERMLDALRLAVGPLGSTGPTPVYEAVLAAILKATTPNAGERG